MLDLGLTICYSIFIGGNMSKQKEWQRFTELRDGHGVKDLTPTEIYLYKHGLHVFAGAMLLIVLIFHIRILNKRKQRKAFAHLDRE